MTAGRSDRRPVKIWRTGRHATPSQVEKVALQAGKAAPAAAIAGALVVVPGASHGLAASAKPVTATASGHTAAVVTADAATTAKAAQPKATLDAVSTRTVTVAAAKPAKHAAGAPSTHYTVRSGDTLSSIAGRYYHNPGDWQYLFHENGKTVSDPNLIYAGESLVVPASVPSNFKLTSYVPKHAAPVQSAPAPAEPAQPSTTVTETSAQRTAPSHSGGMADVVQTASQGSYSCSSLEQLWEQAGGNSADALMAAEIAMAESGGDPNAISPTDDYGLWQINASNGALATLNAFANAKSAITLSDNGTNWGPWTTYTSGAYSGKC
jgi:LysM repeat protein